MHLGSWKFHENENRSLGYLELADCLPGILRIWGFPMLNFCLRANIPSGPLGDIRSLDFMRRLTDMAPRRTSKSWSMPARIRIGVLLDWVPAHFPADEFALANFDGTCLFEHQDPRLGRHAEWDTLIFNYGPRLQFSNWQLFVGSTVSGFRFSGRCSCLHALS